LYSNCAQVRQPQKIQYSAYNVGSYLNFRVWKKRILDEPVFRFILIIFDF
tara:strand:- start:27021 stop:27170 length:150 start_codon:yes stop_codon:yes gene_type:complete